MNYFSREDGSGKYRPVSHDEFSDSDGEGEDFIQQHVRNQKAQMQRQDHGLEMLAQSAQRLGQMSTTISEELDYQNRMLDDMEEDLDVATDNLDLVTLKTREMIQRAGGKQNFLIILVLVGIAMVLFFLILYT